MNKKEKTLILLMVIAICISTVGILLKLDEPILLLVITVPVILVGVWYLYEIDKVLNKAIEKEEKEERLHEFEEYYKKMQNPANR